MLTYSFSLSPDVIWRLQMALSCLTSHWSAGQKACRETRPAGGLIRRNQAATPGYVAVDNFTAYWKPPADRSLGTCHYPLAGATSRHRPLST